MEYLIFGITVIGLIIVTKIFSWPIKKILKLLLNIFLGIVMILIVNNFGSSIGLHIPFNKITALISSLFGLPGVLCLIVINYIF